MVAFNLYAHHEKSSFNFKSSKSLYTFDHRFRIFFELPIKLRKQIYSKSSNLKVCICFHSWAVWKKNRDCSKITRTAYLDPERLGQKWRLFLHQTTDRNSQQNVYFSVHFDMEWTTSDFSNNSLYSDNSLTITSSYW